MKAVVMEIRDGYAAVLVKGGSIERIRDKGYKPGQEIEMPARVIQFSGAFRIITAAAALILLFFGAGICYRRNLKESGYVTVDVNPSLEYAINKKCKVLKVTALNDDAVAIAQRLTESGVKGVKIEEALESTKAELYKAGFLGEEKDNVVLVSVISDDILVRKDLKQAAETVASEEADIAVYVVESTMSERKEAREQGVSTGRYEVSKKASNESTSVKPKESSVKELIENTTLTQVSADELTGASEHEGSVPTEATPVPEITPAVTEAAEPSPSEGGAKTTKKATPSPSDNGAGGTDTKPTDGVQPSEGAEPTKAADGGDAATPTPMMTATPTVKPTATPTPAVATGPTATPTPKPTATPTPKPAADPTATPTPEPTATPTPKPATGPTATPTPTPLPTVTPKPTPTDAPTPTESAGGSAEPTPTEAPAGASDNRVQNKR